MAEERRAQNASKQSSVGDDGGSEFDEGKKGEKNPSSMEGRNRVAAEGGRHEIQRRGGDGEEVDGVVLAEVRLQCGLAWPIIITNLLSYSYIIVSVMFVGHLGELELSSVSIANSFASVSGFAVLIGLTTAMETLCGQAYGAKRYHLLGVYLQTAMIVNYVSCIPIVIIWFNIERILLAVGQDPEISRLAASYLPYMAPGLFCASFSQPLIKFLQAQSLVVPMMICSLISATLHPFVCYTLIYVLGFGFYGGAMATCVSFFLLAILNLGYVLCSGRCRRCWGGVAPRDAVGSIGMYVNLAVPSVVMICFESWAFELLVLSSGLLPKPSLELSLLTICLNTVSLSDMVPLGLCVAASIRVSNELGANRPHAAKLAMKVALGLAIFTGSVVSVTLMLLRNVWGHAFTDIAEIVDYVAEVTPYLALSIFLDFVQSVISGVVRGSGRQALGASINLAAYYIVGIPASLFLGFKLHFNGKGLVMGLVLALFMQMTLLLVLNSCTNWQIMANRAQSRMLQASSEHEPLLPSSSTNGEESK